MDIKLIHTLAVLLFLASFMVKISLMVTNRDGMLEWYTRTLKFVDMGLALIFLGSGIYLWSLWNFVFSISWFTTKFILILAAIPMAIIALRRGSKPLGVISLLVFIYIMVISFTKVNLF